MGMGPRGLTKISPISRSLSALTAKEFLDNSAHGRVIREAETSLRNALSKGCLI
jgi:hypothetical protein